MFKGITLLKNRLWRAENSVGGLRATLSERKCLGKPRGLEQEFTISWGTSPRKRSSNNSFAHKALTVWS